MGKYKKSVLREAEQPERNRILKVGQQVGKSLHLISDEVVRWRALLEIPYQEHLVGK